MVKIAGAKVLWQDRYANDPRLFLLISEYPDRSEFTHEQYLLGNSTLYVAEKQGIVHYLLADPHDRRGYGGEIIPIRVKGPDGKIEIKELEGPWSSRTAIVNRYTKYDVVTVVVTTNYTTFEEGKLDHHTSGGCITVDLARETMEKYLPDCFLEKCTTGDSGISYIPRKRFESRAKLPTADQIMDYTMRLLYSDDCDKRMLERRIDSHLSKYYGKLWRKKFGIPPAGYEREECANVDGD